MSNINESRGKKVASSILAKIRAKHMNEDVEIIEGIEVSTSNYEFSHGKKPKGSGAWMFGKHSSVDFKKHKEGEDYVTVPGQNSYVDAKKKAVEWAKSKGHSRIHALPEEVEDLEELSKGTLNSYVIKSLIPSSEKSISNLASKGGFEQGERGDTDPSAGEREDAKSVKRSLGVLTAVRKLAKEEVEDLEELSRKTLSSYKSKASGEAKKHSRAADIAYNADDENKASHHWTKQTNRQLGGYLASKKLGQNPQYPRRTDKDYGGKVKVDPHNYNQDLIYNKKPKIMSKEEVENLEELSKDTLKNYAHKAMGQAVSAQGYQTAAAHTGDKETYKREMKHKWKRQAGAGRAIDKLTKEDPDMTDTSLSCVEPSSTGEVYKKESETSTAATKPTGTKTGVTSAKTGEAYNTTSMTKRMPALEHSIMGVMQRTFELKKLYAEAADITVVTSEQREDWMSVERGTMNVVDYFNKYKIAGE